MKLNPLINDIIIVGDVNQDIGSLEIQQFYAEIGVQDVHHVVNQILLNNMGNTHISGSWPINLIAATPFIINCIEEYKLLDTNEVLLTDHRLYLIDINLERYFEINLSL